MEDDVEDVYVGLSETEVSQRLGPPGKTRAVNCEDVWFLLRGVSSNRYDASKPIVWISYPTDSIGNERFVFLQEGDDGGTRVFHDFYHPAGRIY